MDALSANYRSEGWHDSEGILRGIRRMSGINALMERRPCYDMAMQEPAAKKPGDGAPASQRGGGSGLPAD